MKNEDWEKLRRTLAAAPEDREVWGELAVALERSRCRPRFVSREEHLPTLLALLREEPGDRRPVGAMAALLGLELVTDTDQTDFTWWGERAAVAVDHLYDRETGVPLRWRRRRDGAEMVLVPSGQREFRSLPSDIGRVFMLDIPPMDERFTWTGDLLLDREPVTVGGVADYRRVVRSHRGPGTGDAVAEAWPAEGVTWSQAVAYGAWVGARLPRFVELRRLGLERAAAEAFGVSFLDREDFAEWVLDEITVEGIRPAGPRRPVRVLLESAGLASRVVELADSEVVAPGRGFRLAIELTPPPRDETPWDGYGVEEAVGLDEPVGLEEAVAVEDPERG